ncbi:hypothetical protein scyTo_0023506 [Scyliorhinus torazame]|uniref:Uncharacterized protein n=1 Tax=Scyliorhinus torazame TaxID=75743 RepID=A0A401QBZ0_SCYTO|nr:hypothetical protein [Scyliorhinus torazame]
MPGAEPDSTSGTLPVQTENAASPSPPDMVDLTEPIDQGVADEVLDLSCRLAELPIDSGQDSDSVVLLDSSPSPTDASTTEEEEGAVAAGPGPAGCQSAGSPAILSPIVQDGPRRFSSQGHGVESEVEMAASGLRSPDSKPLFQPDFNLVLEETMEEGENEQNEEKPVSANSSCSSIGAQPPASPGMGFLGSEEGNSDILLPGKKPRVLPSDSDEESEGDLHPVRAPEKPPCQFVTSPMLKGFNVAATSTPKGLTPPLAALLNRSLNHSVASRHSMVSQVLDDVEDMDDATPVGALGVDDGETDDNVSGQSGGEESAGEQTAESSQSPPGGRSVEESRAEGSSELGMGSDDEGVSDSSSSMATGSNEEAESERSGTFDPELGSGEQLETFTKATDQQQSVTNDRAAGDRVEPTLGEYEKLVKDGREQMERGELKAALKSMLQALDLSSGDPEVQLTTIKLYRQLDRS